jgi:hypothetical protein
MGGIHYKTRIERVVECDSDPVVPVMVIVDRAPKRPLVAVTVNVDVEDVGFGENEPLSPAASPDADNVTGPLKPLVGVIVTV